MASTEQIEERLKHLEEIQHSDPVQYTEQLELLVDETIELDQDDLIGKIRTRWSEVLISQVRNEELIVFSQERIDQARKNSNKKAETDALNTLAIGLAESGRHDDAYEVFLQIEKLFIKDNAPDETMVRVYLNMGSMLQLLERWEEALAAGRKGLEYAKNQNNDYFFAYLYNNVGNSAQHIEGKMDEAIEGFKQSLKYSISRGDKSMQGQCLCMIARIEFKKGNLDLAEELFEQGMSLINESGDQRMNTNVFIDYAELSEMQGKYEKSVGLLKKSIEFKDRTHTQNKERAISEMQARFNVDQKKREAAIFKAKNEELEKAYKELEETQNDLIAAERMAALGKIAQQIAHEVQNPLNFVNNFSSINKEILEEILPLIVKGEVNEDVIEDLKTIIENTSTIHEHGSNVAGIVSKLLSKTWTKEDEDLHHFKVGEPRKDGKE